MKSGEVLNLALLGPNVRTVV